MALCKETVSVWSKQRGVTTILTAGNVPPTDIHCTWGRLLSAVLQRPSLSGDSHTGHSHGRILLLAANEVINDFRWLPLTSFHEWRTVKLAANYLWHSDLYSHSSSTWIALLTKLCRGKGVAVSDWSFSCWGLWLNMLRFQGWFAPIYFVERKGEITISAAHFRVSVVCSSIYLYAKGRRVWEVTCRWFSGCGYSRTIYIKLSQEIRGFSDIKISAVIHY